MKWRGEVCIGKRKEEGKQENKSGVVLQIDQGSKLKKLVNEGAGRSCRKENRGKEGRSQMEKKNK